MTEQHKWWYYELESGLWGHRLSMGDDGFYTILFEGEEKARRLACTEVTPITGLDVETLRNTTFFHSIPYDNFPPASLHIRETDKGVDIIRGKSAVNYDAYFSLLNHDMIVDLIEGLEDYLRFARSREENQ